MHTFTEVSVMEILSVLVELPPHSWQCSSQIEVAWFTTVNFLHLHHKYVQCSCMS